MKVRLMVSLALFTAVVCFFFMIANPVLSSEIEQMNFTEGEVFRPSDGHFDFGTFSLNDSNVSCFRVKYVESGHVLLVDESGDKVINVVQFEKMINLKKDQERNFIGGELLKPGWMVDGVDVHEVVFLKGSPLYSACTKDISSDTMIYLATPSDRETAGMISTLEFEK